jgi:hypothetical protein
VTECHGDTGCKSSVFPHGSGVLSQLIPSKPVIGKAMVNQTYGLIEKTRKCVLLEERHKKVKEKPH